MRDVLEEKIKVFNTLFGKFVHLDVPSMAFPFGVWGMKEGDYFCIR